MYGSPVRRAGDRCLLQLVLLTLALVFGSVMASCATGRTDSGGVVLGFEAGQLIDNTNQLGGALAEAIGGGNWGTIVGGGLASLFGVGGVGYFVRSLIHRAADKSWDERDALARPDPMGMAAPRVYTSLHGREPIPSEERHASSSRLGPAHASTNG